MWILYAISFVPVLIGAVLWVKSRDVVWWEWGLGSLAALVTSMIFHGILVTSMTKDVETWSGRVTHVVFYPKWIEEYQQMHTRTVGSGKNARTETYWTTEHRTHREKWVAFLSFGSEKQERSISEAEYSDIKQKFGDKVDVTQPRKSGFDSGDPNVYTVQNHTNIILPAVTSFYFENRVKAAPSMFSYQKVDAKAPVFKYPEVQDWRKSDRLLGTALRAVPLLEWDRMNARLGPSKRVNVILVGFDSADSGLGQLQEAKWVGGKKNDLVLCYGEQKGKILWSHVFGWTEQEIVKRNLETILLHKSSGMDFIPKVEEEIKKNYKIKDWSKFDYITLQPPLWSYFVLLLLMTVIQGGLWFFFVYNDIGKKG
jgi:hypothetical protein